MDPLSRAGKQVLDDYIRRVIRGMLKEELNYQPNNVKQSSVINDYMMQASFIPYFNNKMIKPLVRGVAMEAMEDVAIGEVVSDMLDKEVA